MYNAAGLVFDYDQYIEQPKRCCNDHTKVTGHYGCRMVANKGGPELIATRLWDW
jgi:hypothetical protein